MSLIVNQKKKKKAIPMQSVRSMINSDFIVAISEIEKKNPVNINFTVAILEVGKITDKKFKNQIYQFIIFKIQTVINLNFIVAILGVGKKVVKLHIKKQKGA